MQLGAASRDAGRGRRRGLGRRRRHRRDRADVQRRPGRRGRATVRADAQLARPACGAPGGEAGRDDRAPRPVRPSSIRSSPPRTSCPASAGSPRSARVSCRGRHGCSTARRRSSPGSPGRLRSTRQAPPPSGSWIRRPGRGTAGRCEAAGVPIGLLPPIRPATAVAGTLTAEAADLDRVAPRRAGRGGRGRRAGESARCGRDRSGRYPPFARDRGLLRHHDRHPAGGSRPPARGHRPCRPRALDPVARDRDGRRSPRMAPADPRRPVGRRVPARPRDDRAAGRRRCERDGRAAVRALADRRAGAPVRRLDPRRLRRPVALPRPRAPGPCGHGGCRLADRVGATSTACATAWRPGRSALSAAEASGRHGPR